MLKRILPKLKTLPNEQTSGVQGRPIQDSEIRLFERSRWGDLSKSNKGSVGGSKEKESAAEKGLTRKLDLTTKDQRAFLKAYLEIGNAVKAYESVFPGKRHGSLLVKSAFHLLNHPKIQRQLQKTETKALAKVEEVAASYCITKERIAAELAKIAFADVRNMIEWDENGVRVKGSEEISDDAAGAISEVYEIANNKASKALLKIKSYDKTAALIALGKELGMFKERVDHRVGVVAKFVIED